MEVFLESFPRLSVDRFVGNVGVLFVSGTFVILRAVGLPIAQAHPAKIVFTAVTLHMVTAAILLDANITFRALQRKKI